MILKIKLNAKTSFSNLLTADQIFGHFMWAISDLYGEEIANLCFESASKDKILFSSMMLDGFVPVPMYLNTFCDPFSEVGKHNKKCKWISISDFLKFQKTPTLFSKTRLDLDVNDIIEIVSEVHTAVDGLTFSALDGALYSKQYLFSSNPLCFYVLVHEGLWKDIIPIICSHFCEVGLGGDRNAGHGQVSCIVDCLTENEEAMFSFSADKFISLSECFGPDLIPLNYAVDVYSGVAARTSLYRKKPVIRYKAGSLFLSGEGKIEKTGCDDKISSYGFAFPVYVNI